MRTTRSSVRRSAHLRRAALLSTAVLSLGLLAVSPLAASSAWAAPGSAAAKGTPTDEDRATAADLASGAVRTEPDKSPKAPEVQDFAVSPSGKLPPKAPEASADGDDIVGGTIAGSAPFYVALKSAGGGTGSFCGATLISSVWVLTAAHCVDGSVTPASLRLVIGAPSWNNEAAGDVRSVTSINIHPSWNPTTFDNDVALLRLNTAATKTWARLAEPADPVNPGNTVRAYGHGDTTEGGSQSADLRMVDLPVQSDATMSAAAQYGSRFHGNVMIGAGPLAGGQDTCQGDSGGPLVANPGAIQPALVGDVSWGDGCARANKPGIYAEVYQGALRTFVNGIVGRPGNDNFAGFGISGADGTVSGSNTDSTGQPGEPSIGGSGADTSVWYSWTAPASGPTSFNTRGSAFDTTLGVFTGNAVNALTPVASNDDSNGTRQSKATFNAVAGTTYRIAVDGFSAAFGAFTLQWAQNSPGNDNFASPTTINNATGKTSQSTARSTGEPGEPEHAGVPDRSVWFSWTAPESGPAVFSTRESNFDTTLAAYTGSTITGLTRLASNDDTNGRQSRIAFTATAGTTYRIAVDGFGGATGDLGLQWTTSPPANDDFSSPRVLLGKSGSLSWTTVRSSGEPGELDYHGGAIADNSVWFSWAPTITGQAAVRISNATFAVGVQVYTGSNLASLTTVLDGGASGGTFSATAGTTYRIAVDGNSGTTGTFDLGYASLTVPGTPVLTGSVPGQGSVDVSFSEPSDTGGQPITQYYGQCVSSDGGVTGATFGTSSPIRVSGLGGSKTYRCRVQARNASGWGPYTAFGPSVVTAAVTAPSAPVLTGTAAGTSTATVTFTAPANDGGSPITQYYAQCVSSDGGVLGAKLATTGPIAVSGLSGGKTYRCRVQAKNAVGWGPYTAFGSSVTLAATAPSAPTLTGSTPSATAVSVAFGAPAQDGGAPVTQYYAQCVSTDGGVLGAKLGTANPLTVSALTGGKSYRCRVQAKNSVGWGPYSAFGPTVLVPSAAGVTRTDHLVVAR